MEFPKGKGQENYLVKTINLNQTVLTNTKHKKLIKLHRPIIIKLLKTSGEKSYSPILNSG